MVESPDDEKIDEIYNFKPRYGKSLNEYIRWMLTTDSNYRERMQDNDRRARAIKELVSKWRKAQITHTDYKQETSPDLYKEAIVKHASDWFEDKIKDTMKEMDIPLKRAEQKELKVYLPPTKKRGWFGNKETHSIASKKGWVTRRANQRKAIKRERELGVE
jgi:hypothetical protein